jgi:hypothetical protein
MKFREKVLTLTEEYARIQLGCPTVENSDGYVTFLSGGESRYLIESQKIFTGLIDRDEEKDALVTLLPVNNLTEKTKHLIILGKNGNPVIYKTIESDMKILQLSDRIITAEVPEYPRSSPLFNCHECREIVKYRLNSGELEKIE